ncbi:MAG: hypothetical protein LBG52_04075 [Candidatus Peribacteria bacterium]|nr:hypothetical protein [Candidatus Peribacteria bacterium]
MEPIDSTGNNNVFSPNLVDCFTNETENFFEPNENGHYLLKEGNNWYILNEKKEKLSTTAFEYLIPYEGGMYLGKVKHTLFYLDYENGVERYFDVSTGKPLPKNSNDAEVTPSKKITDIQERTFHLS